MDYNNKMRLEFINKSENESFARVAVAAFISQTDPTIEELIEIKTAISEAVTNSIIHAYEKNEEGIIVIQCSINGQTIEIIIEDYGIGISDIEKAREPLYTSKPEQERSGMGFTVMETFMDEVEVQSVPGEGTKVILTKTLNKD
ncbi:MAG: anti-sigma F factor [Clostridiales bacterium]|nr:anti-sigma F factor [Clostridiales bacterium]